ncbi:MAG: hypothetical protein ACFFAS_00780 [Promethearchaeota archaeon]
MEKNKKLLKKTEDQLSKADLLLENKQFKKAGKSFDDVGDKYLKLNEYSSSEQCFAKAASAHANQGNISAALTSLRNAGNVCLMVDQYMEAHKYFNNAVKLNDRERGTKEGDANYLLFSSLSYLCYLLVGRPDQGLTSVKQVKKKVDSEVFKENSHIRLVKDFSVALQKKKSMYLDKIEQEFDKYKFNDVEKVLVKKALITTKAQLSLLNKLVLDKEQYSTDDLIKASLEIDTTPLIDISHHAFYNHEINEVKVAKMEISSSDNLSIQKKTTLPVIIAPGQTKIFEVVFKTNFQIDESYIGPIILTCELDDLLTFYVESEVIYPEIISPPSKLEMSTKNLRPPLIDQSFPLELTIENVGESETFEVKIDVEFPEQLKVMRGTTSKQIYSLRMKESINWEIQLKPVEAGDFHIKTTIKFKDPDQNEIEQVQEFPLSIKL